MKIGIGWMAMAMLAACGDEGGGPTTTSGGPCDPAVDARGQAVGCVTGAVVDPAGKPVDAISVGACTGQICIKTTTDAQGRYTIQGLTVVPYMMKVFGVPKGYMTTTWFQDTKPGEMVVAPREIVLVPQPGGKVALPESGGSATVAAGKLEITADDGSLSYPIGEPEELEVAMVDVEELPPQDVEPWTGKEAKTLVFVVNPFAVTLDGPIQLKVKGTGAAAGTPYRIYASDHLTGRLIEGGSLVADAAGDLVLQPGASLENLTTLVIVPN